MLARRACWACHYPALLHAPRTERGNLSPLISAHDDMIIRTRSDLKHAPELITWRQWRLNTGSVVSTV